MKRFALPLSLTALAVLAACATEEPARPAPAPPLVITPAPVVTAPPPTVVVQPAAPAPAVVQAPTPAPAALRTGFGRIESITALPPSAAAGGGTTTMRRLGIRMDDGTMQYVDTPAPGLETGNRVELTKDGTIRRS